MTLREWADTNNVNPRVFDKPGYDRLMTVIDRSYPNRADLWHLDDYVVTSVQAGTIWLAPRG